MSSFLIDNNYQSHLIICRYNKMAMKVTQQTSQILGSGSRMQFIAIVVLELLLVEGIYGWTYNHSKEEMPWNNARKFCKEKYTDMVAIQNAEEIKYLNENVPFAKSYYWIGIRKVNDTWIWVGTAKPLNKEAENWAKGEPNNVGKTGKEDCVEMYIKRKLDPGKWNDIACGKKKRPLCYTASCSPKSCSNNGECIETIGYYSCLCNDGFYGPECEHAVQCATLEDQEQMTMTCSKPRAPFSYNTTCEFSCADGFELRGSEQLECGATGQWSAAAPHCEAVQCATLEDQEQMTMTCSKPRAPFSYNTTCEFSCADGFELRGSEQLECGATGQWFAAAPHCEAVQCATLEDQEQMTMTCSKPRAPFSYNTTCEFSCADGFELRGSEQLECGATGQWSAAAPHCEAVQCENLEKQDQVVMTCSEKFRYSSTCSFSCQDGFTLSGASRIDCAVTGQWTAPVPTCQAVQCATLEDQEQMTMTCSKPRAPFSYNTTCEFSCADGFELRGSEQLECGATGQWSAAAPYCEGTMSSFLIDNNYQSHLIICRYNKMAMKVTQQTSQILGSGSRMQFIAIVVLELLLVEGIYGWTYNHSKEEMPWNNARKFCKEKYTDMVAIQNAEEIKYLNENVPFAKSYYWIGIRKVNDTWIWVGTAKPLNKEAENWAKGEPNNVGKTGKEDCVEMYIKRKLDPGKWNDIACGKKKRPLCYTASCSPKSCSNNGECIETIGYYSCLCNDGFYGPECEHAVQCATLEDQEQMTMTCSKPRAPFSYNTTCEFSCADGFELRGSEQLECGATGQWSAAAPHCEAVQCATLEDQEQMTMTCSKPRAPFSYNTTCEFSCADGFELRGSEQLECGATGQWSAAAPHCEAVKCGVLQIPENGKIHCSHPMDNLRHRSVCKFDCLEGYLLNGSVSVECDGSGQWSSPIPTCEDSNPQPIHENSTPIIISSAVASGVSGLMMIAWIARQLRKKAQGKTFSLLSKEAQKTSGTYKLNEEV
ncbi:P-selectin-like [Rhinoraja longicauda]